MHLTELLREHREAILDRWFDLIVKTYPGLSSVFLHKKQRWGNPVGTNIEDAIAGLYDELLKDEAGENLAPQLDRVVRIRSVQEYSPSEAVAILIFIKHVVREHFTEQINAGEVPVAEVLRFESKVDSMMLVAFDIYTKCRNQLFELRLEDFKRHFSGVLRQKGITVDYPKFE
ncbi:MAG: RsbRD N-terminal domain-containing protein [Proteobacteria bacterium]|nr:RsbRD N-terminal domain-containing protein [Pseudomonadota bacterium]